MIEMKWISNESTKERRLYYRYLAGYMDASGAFNVSHATWSGWVRVAEQTLDESALSDLIESGGIVNAP